MKIQYLFIFTFLIFISCNDSEPIIIYEPAGLAEYYVNNKSDTALDIVFITSAELSLKTSDSIHVASNTITKIFEDSIIGVNPKPINSFSEIRFYTSPNTSNEPLLIISEITNDDWVITEQDLGDTGYGITKYELTITNNSFIN